MRPLHPFLALLLLAAAACDRSPSARSGEAAGAAPGPETTPDGRPDAAPPSPVATAAPGDAAPSPDGRDAGEPGEGTDGAEAAQAPAGGDTTATDEGADDRVADAGPIAVAVYRGRGVAEEGLRAALAALRGDDRFEVREVSPEAIRRGALAERRVAFFSGGIGSVQGGELGPEGRRIVREFVREGGGYVGICAGAYLAIQGPPQYHHLAIVAARNWSEDAWRRGTAMLEVAPVGGGGPLRLFYANGPVFRRDEREGLASWTALATYVDDRYCESCGTHAGELPGTPAILAASYGAGRIVLFSPNPTLSRGDEPAHPELFLAAMRWVSTPGPVPADPTFDDVFGGR
ncbi:MAG: hypothetical protein JXB32_07900 [Deltaproteobacteria bacterium]|nr:hypothetical protein [Deltaproteobacteria bacterium]